MTSRVSETATEEVAPVLGGRVGRVRRFVDPIAFAALFVFAWQAFIWITGFHSVVLPPPSKVWGVLWNQGDFLVGNMLTTAVTIGWGFFLGGVMGFVSGVLIYHFEGVKRAIHPILVSLYVVPKAVFIPLLILWWGVGFEYKLLVTVLLAFFPVTENTITGLNGVEREMVELTRSLRGNRWFGFRKVSLPFASPFVLAGLRIALTESFIGGVLSEILVPGSVGIGSRIVEAAAFSNTEFIIASIMVIAAFGIVSYFLFLWLERKLTFWV